MYYFAELQNLQSFRNAEPLIAKTLAGAKREATRRQSFAGTILKIGTKLTDEGLLDLNYVVAAKINGEWFTEE